MDWALELACSELDPGDASQTPMPTIGAIRKTQAGLQCQNLGIIWSACNYAGRAELVAGKFPSRLCERLETLTARSMATMYVMMSAPGHNRCRRRKPFSGVVVRQQYEVKLVN